MILYQNTVILSLSKESLSFQLYFDESALCSSMNHLKIMSKTDCHLDRSEAKWRDQ